MSHYTIQELCDRLREANTVAAENQVFSILLNIPIDPSEWITAVHLGLIENLCRILARQFKLQADVTKTVRPLPSLAPCSLRDSLPCG